MWRQTWRGIFDCAGQTGTCKKSEGARLRIERRLRPMASTSDATREITEMAQFPERHIEAASTSFFHKVELSLRRYRAFSQRRRATLRASAIEARLHASGGRWTPASIRRCISLAATTPSAIEVTQQGCIRCATSPIAKTLGTEVSVVRLSVAMKPLKSRARLKSPTQSRFGSHPYKTTIRS